MKIRHTTTTTTTNLVPARVRSDVRHIQSFVSWSTFVALSVYALVIYWRARAFRTAFSSIEEHAARPRVVHVIHANESSLDKLQKTWLDGCKRLNADFEYQFWSDEVTDAFVQNKHPEWYARWKALTPRMKQIDLSRYMLMYSVGGVYHDLDFECVRPFSEMYDRYSERRAAVWLTGWPDPAFMMSMPNQEFWKYAIDTVLASSSSGDASQQQDVWHTTGPDGLNRYAYNYLRDNGLNLGQNMDHYVDKAKLAADKEAQYVQTRAEASTIGFLDFEFIDPTSCNRGVLDACEPLCASAYPEAYVIHHCKSSWRGAVLGQA